MAESMHGNPQAVVSRRRWMPLGLILGALGASLLFVRCFSPSLPACSYRCNTTEPRCPDEYECRTDGYCHLKGNGEQCSFSMDLSPAPPDMATPIDMARIRRAVRRG
jgi:hypothetical protein